MNIPTETELKKIWTLVPYEIQDLPDIARFFKRNYTGPGSYGSMDLFHWKIIDNPVMPGIINLVKDNGKIVSTTSVTPKRLFLRRQEYQVAEIGDTYTDPSYQRQGLFALLINQSTQDALSKGINFIYGTPNNQSLPGYEKKAKYRTIPSVKVQSLTLPVDIKPYIQDRIGWLLGSYATPVFYTILSVYLFARKLLSGPSLLSVDEVGEIPDGWEEFWSEAKAPFDFIIVRDRRTLTWRYFQSPGKYRFYVLREHGRVVAYLVYRIIFDTKATDLVIADYLTLPGRERDLKVLFFKAFDDAAKAGVSKVSTWCTADGGYFEVFRGFGFIERSEIPIISFQNDFARALQDNCRRWHFTVGDSDNV